MEGRAAAIVPLVNDVADLPEKRNEILKIVITVYGLSNSECENCT